MADRADFDRCWPYLEPAIGKPASHTKQHVWDKIASGQADFWPMERSAIVTNFLRYPTGLVDGNGWLAGGDWDELRGWIPIIEQHMKAHGADRVLIRGRPGFQRTFAPYGYRLYGVQIVKEL